MSVVPEELPEGWTNTNLGEVVESSTAKVEPGEDDDAPYLSLEHIESNSTRIVGRGRGADVKSTKNVFRAGDVLYGKLRPYLNKVCRPDFGGICSTDILVLRPSEALDPGFLFRVLTSSQFVAHAMANSNGINLPRTSFTALSEFELGLPPLPEQRRIVDKIEALQVRSRKAREALEAIPPLLEQFRQSVLAAAFRGDLTADWREQHSDTEPASVLLERIRTDRRRTWEQAELAKFKTKGKVPKDDSWKEQYIEPEFVDDVDLPELPEGWCWERVGLLGVDPFCAVQTGPFGAQLHNTEFVDSGVPVIAVGNLTGLGFTTEGLYFVTSQKAAALARYDVHAGDILFARSGATLGKVCVAPEFVSDWRMTGHILRGRLRKDVISPELVVFALWGDATVKSLVTGGIRGMTRPGFNTGLLEGIPIPIPPREEQDEILRQVMAALGRIEALEKVLDEIASEADMLNQSILAKAFRGGLVPQDPNDEPASVLLERIRAERADDTNDKPPRGHMKTNAST